MSVRSASRYVPLSHGATVLTYQDRLQASLLSLPNPKATEASATPKGKVEFSKAELTAAGWPSVDDAQNFLILYDKNMLYRTIRDWDNRTTYDEGMNNIRKAFMLPGFVKALDQDQTGQEKWSYKVLQELEEDLVEFVSVVRGERLKKKSKLPPEYVMDSEETREKKGDAYVAAMQMVTKKMLPFKQRQAAETSEESDSEGRSE